MSDTETKAKTRHILLVDDDTEHAALIKQRLDDAVGDYSLDVATTFDDAVTHLEKNVHDVFLVNQTFEKDRGLEVVWDITGRGCKGPAILISEEDTHEGEAEAVNLGAMLFLVWDQFHQPRFLERMLNHAVERKRQEDNIRDDQEGLIQRMMDLQDSRERFEAQSVEYIEMAEELSLAQDELKKALKDVTEREQELQKLNQEKNRFFSIIAHDLRSPFTSLLGYTGMIAMAADKLSPEQIVEYSANIDESAKRVFGLLENLLEWARLQMDQIASEPLIIRMAAIAQRTVDVLGPVGDDKGVAVSSDIGDDITAFADEHMIDTVIRNLTSNAIKFTAAPGTVTIAGENTGDQCQISITDSGVGMTPGQIDTLFSIGDANSTKGTGGEGGTGLGLLLCKDLLEKNNGSIEVTSTPGEGSTFTITLPVS
ncbi:MAG: response regulator [Rhodospirillaceae bacterium]|mgnify:CR=1 FL=1|jgi:signal transduction histidine kinase|nr:response regulator [Rhodospirillaceae bacterium]MBT4220446.1 response regulator [Rhodospirillaceae bacterium]MBT5013162.1 response regulator [Rhodospirillaceae bacterium]MBT6406150.1 response regulator [Rhodospirillaceae bacterium]MBT7355036.1 response regulator [Rhodospirillaceae bacterium]